MLKEQTLPSTCSHLLHPLFSDNFCRKLCLMTQLLMWYTLVFKESGFQIILTKHFHMHISIQEFLIPLHCQVAGCSILHLLGKCKNLQFMATSSYYNPTNYASRGSLRTYNSQLHHMPQSYRRHLQTTSEIILICYSASPYQGYGQSNVYVLCLAVVKARKISIK